MVLAVVGPIMDNMLLTIFPRLPVVLVELVIAIARP